MRPSFAGSRAVLSTLTLVIMGLFAVPGRSSGGFVHPGLLHTSEDLARMREKWPREPWKGGYRRLMDNPHSQLSWTPAPLAVVIRGGEGENYSVLYNDVAAAYALALRYHVSGDKRFADKAVAVMNAWSSKLEKLTGNNDEALLAGLQGYQFANAAELLRNYPGWQPKDFKRFQDMMLDKFLPINVGFLAHHNGSRIDHHFANWDLCNMCSLLSIGVLCDKRSLYHDAIEYFKHGGGNGAIRNNVNFIHPGGLGQLNESGRDQGHAGLCIALMAAFCEMAWNQGDDLYGYDHNRVLAGATYFARYNLGHDVPFAKYSNQSRTHTVISPEGRGNDRPGWETLYNHYANRCGLAVPDIKAYAERVRPEGGGGDYGPSSGGYDQLGYGTLAFTRDPGAGRRRSGLRAAEGTREEEPGEVAGDAVPEGKVLRLQRTTSFFSTQDPTKFMGVLRSGTELTVLGGVTNGMVRVKFKLDPSSTTNYVTFCRRSDLGI